MGTSPGLPHPEVCKAEKLIASADFWTCLVAEPDPCHYLVKIGELPICSIASRSGTALRRKLQDKRVYVRYADSSLGLVPRGLLDELIEKGRITAFERSSGWVDISKGPIRQRSSHWQFKGLQRRVGKKGEESPPAVKYIRPANRPVSTSYCRKPLPADK